MPLEAKKTERDETRYAFYQADHLLTTPERAALAVSGMEILSVLQGHVYWVSVTAPLPAVVEAGLFQLDPGYKIGLSTDARASVHRLRLTVAPGLAKADVIDWAIQNGISILDARALSYGVLDIEVAAIRLRDIAATPWVCYIGRIPEDEEIQYRAHAGERAWGLTSSLTRDLDGSGMTVGIGDGGRLGFHDDLSDDVLDLASFGVSTHAMQVAGIITGAGAIDPFFGRGYAPEAHVIVRNFSDILWDAPQYISDYGMSLTNNSYGAGLSDCVYFGDYDGTSAGLDAMMYDHPSLLHVFAAANSGGLTCTPYPFRYATIAGGYQPAKNVLTVGAITNMDANAGFSSRGPVEDGRLKPEVVAYGNGRFSTTNNHLYASNSGTSFSSPAATGVATLLYQRYRQLHQDSLPDAALIKNVMCNAADDLGPAGPDYTFGFGRINGVRAAKILEDGHFRSFEIDHADTVFHSITLPAGVAFADVMLMWTDPASAPFETVTLVHDLDMVVITPGGDTLKPWKLNYTPAGVALAATTGNDRINNCEQVTLHTPVAGTYTIMLTGHSVPLGPQKAWLTWDIAMSGITVVSPIGGEIFKPGNNMVPNDQYFVRWDAYGTGASTFSVELSLNSGANWTVIATGLAADRRYMGWYPPQIPTGGLMARVTASNGMSGVSGTTAVIMSAPSGLSASSPCHGYETVSWNAVTGATHYQVYRILKEKVILLDTTISTSIVIQNLPTDTAVWISVAGVLSSGKIGLRARAILVTPNGGHACPWDHDLRIEALNAPVSGRRLTSTALSIEEPITLQLTNAGQEDASGFSLYYTIDDGPVKFESFPGSLTGGSSVPFTFFEKANLSMPGSYIIKVWHDYALDTSSIYDTLVQQINHFGNPPIVLPWTEGFEGIPDTLVIAHTTGLPGLDAWDAVLQDQSRIRTFAGQPFMHTGTRALTVDAIRTTSSKSADVILTLNMNSYAVAQDDIRLSLYVMHHEIIPDVSNTEAIWIRGSDTDPFLLLTYISNDANYRGVWQHVSGLEISRVLEENVQEFSASTQIKFAHDVFATAGHITSQDGQTIDQLSLHLVERDLTIDEIVHPASQSCSLDQETIQVRVVNTTLHPVEHTFVYYQLNSGLPIATPVGTIPANSSMIVDLAPAADFSATGTYTLKVWVSSVQDDFIANDTLLAEILHTPLITVFPYTEDFENGDGGYITGGIRSTWQHGVPGKQIISRAAEGEKVWTTSLTATHRADEWSYLYSPCFDISGMADPWLSFALRYQLELQYDYAWIEYRPEGATQWTKLGTQNSGGVHWYNDASNRWNGNQLPWITAGHAIPYSDTVIQFRWVMFSDVGLEMEGIALDQIHVYDRKPLYTGSSVQVTAPVAGSGWVHLEQAGARIFSIDPQGQDLGDVTVDVYLDAQDFTIADSLYLLSRHWKISATNPPQNAIRLRGYFTHTEASHLTGATGCGVCIQARDGFDVAALRYTGPFEDDQYGNNTTGMITAYHVDETELYPYDQGYMAEWSSGGLSEWWITSPVTRWSGTLARRISASYDDAEEHPDNGAVNPVRSRLALTSYDGDQIVGWRFRNMTIPPGTYISGAQLRWIASDMHSAPGSLKLQAEMSASPASFNTSKYNISLRPRSEQIVRWEPQPWTTIDAVYTSPEIRHLIQQVIDQPGWVNGADLVLILRGEGLREAWSYDGDPVKGAELTITFDSLCTAGGTIYVDGQASGQQDGISWTEAYRNLEQALDQAAHCPDVEQIWIAEGVYSPDASVPRTRGYIIPDGVSVYGGFEGHETAVTQRVYGAFPTVLSGDIGQPGIMTDNLYRVVTIQAGVDGVLLDGVDIRDGRADGPQQEWQRGSGIYNLGRLTGHRVSILECSAPAVYNAMDALLQIAVGLDIRP